ncbi:MAG TPA: large conductance mechanosensitive channel protein MscL [Chthoniobacterales bacterium]
MAKVAQKSKLKPHITRVTMAIFDEFREFAFKGNVIDLAVGVIIGAAFGKIVTSLVNNIFMPIIGLILGRVDFSNLFIVLNGQHVASLKEATDRGVPVFAYGMFINTVIEFLIIAFCLFLVIKQVNQFKKPAASTSAGPSAEEVLLTEIRDLLKTGQRL